MKSFFYFFSVFLVLITFFSCEKETVQTALEAEAIEAPKIQQGVAIIDVLTKSVSR